MFRTILRVVVPLVLLVMPLVNVPRSHAASRSHAATAQLDFCSVDIVLQRAEWIQGQGAVEGKLETLIEVLVNDDLVFKFGSGSVQLTPGVPRVFDETITTVAAFTGPSVSIEGFVKEFDGAALGLDDFGSKTSTMAIDCEQETQLGLVVEVPGRAVLEGTGQMLLRVAARPH